MLTNVKLISLVIKLCHIEYKKVTETRRIDRLWGHLKRPGFPVAGSVSVGKVEKMRRADAFWVVYIFYRFYSKIRYEAQKASFDLDARVEGQFN